jgi:protein-L-isoaspartate(D-aspartate) O-methyltransferase
MVEGQIRTNKVTDSSLIAALSDLPRERFVPPAWRGTAYVDEDLPLGQGRHLMEPMVLARLLQTADVAPSDVALVIGSGAGYSAAVLARLCTTVVAIEENSTLAGDAAALLSELGIDNAVVVEGALATGYARQAPYDVILIDGAVAEIPAVILDQLAEGGRLVTVVRAGRVGRATLVSLRGGAISRRIIFDAATPLLPGFVAEQHFAF